MKKIDTEKAVAKDRSARKQQQRCIDTRRSIMQAALKMFAKKGFKGATTREIAELAGIRHPLISYHFKTKDGLWQAVVEDIFENYHNRFRKSFEKYEILDAPSRLKIVLWDMIQFASEQPEVHLFMIQMSYKDRDKFDWLLDKYARKDFEIHCARIKEAQKQGLMIDGDPAILRRLQIEAVYGLFVTAHEHKVLTGKDAFDPDNVREYAETVIRLFFPYDKGGGQSGKQGT